MSEDDAQTTKLGEYAGFITRLIAWLIDRAIIVVVFWLIAFIGDFVVGSFSWERESYQIIMNVVVVIVDIIIYLLYYVGGWMVTGQTPGKSIMGLRVIRTDGKRLKLRNALVRLVGYWISTLLFFMGYWWVLFDKSRQGWHDHLARTYVVYAETWEERAQQKRMLQDHQRMKQQKISQQNSGK